MFFFLSIKFEFKFVKKRRGRQRNNRHQDIKSILEKNKKFKNKLQERVCAYINHRVAFRTTSGRFVDHRFAINQGYRLSPHMFVPFVVTMNNEISS